MKHIGSGTGCRLVAVFQQVLPGHNSGKRASFPDPIDPGQRDTPASERPSRFMVRRIASAHRFLPLEKPRPRRAPPDFPGPPRPPMPRIAALPPKVAASSLCPASGRSPLPSLLRCTGLR